MVLTFNANNLNLWANRLPVLQVPVTLFFEPSIIYWFAIITVLAVAASWGPAQGAIQVSIRESLSYE